MKSLCEREPIRPLRGAVLLGAVLSLTACPGPAPEPMEDTAEPPIDSYLLPPVPYLVFIRVTFSYDPATDAAVATIMDGAQSQPTLLFGVATEGWSGSLSDPESVCFATLSAGEAIPRARWVENFGDQIFGFDFPEFRSVQDNCIGFLDDARYPDLAQTLSQFTWAVSVAPQIDPDYRSQLLRGGVSEERLANMIGGGFGGSLGEFLSSDNRFDSVLTEGEAVDERFFVQLDEDEDPIELTPTEMVVNNELQRGFYSMQTVVSADVLDLFYR